MHVFRERASAITQTKILSQGRPQVVRDVILSSKPKYSERKYGLQMWKKRIFFCKCSSFAKTFEANMPACRCVVQDCSNKSNPRIGISLHTPKCNYELAKWKSFVRTHSSNFNPNGRFKICSVHFSSDCFEWTVHKEGAPRRLITGSIPTIWKPSEESSAISARSRRRVSK